MEKIIRTLLVLSCVALSGNAYAVNWGLTASYSAGDAEDHDENLDGDNDFFSVGVALDTGDAGRTFNYRGALSYVDGKFDGDFDNDSFFPQVEVEADYRGVAIDNTFGFRVGGNSTTRIWLGPAIDLQFLDVDDVGDAVSLAVGGTVGVDLYPATGSLFSLETGFRVGGLYIDADDDDSFDNDDLEFDTTGFFVRGTVFFTRPQQ